MAEEQINATTSADKLAQGAAALQTQYQQRADQSAQRIGGLYDNALAAQKAGLKTAYDQSLADQTAARDAIAGTYRAANNDLAIQYERNRRNLNEQAAANGINTGAGSQQQLALNQGYMKGFGQLRAGQAAQYSEADRQIANLKMNYQNQIASAIADNDYKRAAALLDDFNNQNNWRDQQAQIMASYGNFSGYAGLYGPEQADMMRQVWAMQNPDMAWATGNITEEQYQQLTGRKPHKVSNGGGGAWWAYTGGGGSEDNDSSGNGSGSSGSSGTGNLGGRNGGIGGGLINNPYASLR